MSEASKKLSPFDWNVDFLCELQASDVLVKMGLDFQAEKRGDARPPIPGPQSRVVLGTMMQSKYAMLSCNRVGARDPAIYHPIHPGEPLTTALQVVDINFEPIMMRHPLFAPFLSAVLCDKPSTSEVLSCLEVRPIYGRLQDPRRCWQTFWAYQGVYQASSFVPTLCISLPHPCGNPGLCSIVVLHNLLVAPASPYRVTKE